MPVTQRNLGLHVRARRLPTGSGEFVFVTVVAELHYEVDANTLVAIVVIVALPEGTKAVGRNFPVIAEVPAERFKLAAVHVAAKDHSFLIRLAARVHFVASEVDDRLAAAVLDLTAAVTEVEIQLAVRPEVKGVDAVIVLGAGDAGEEQLFSIGLEITVVVVQEEDAVAAGDNNLRPFAARCWQNANAMCRINVVSLIKDSLLVADAIAVGVFKDQDAIPLLPLAEPMSIVHNLANPNSAEMVDVDAGRIEHCWIARFGCEQGRFQPFRYVQSTDCVLRVAAADATLRAASIRGDEELWIGLVSEDQESNCRTASLIYPVVIDRRSAFEFRKGVPVWQGELNHRVRVRPDAIFGLLAVDGDRLAATIFVDANLAETRAGGLPFHLGQL